MTEKNNFLVLLWEDIADLSYKLFDKIYPEFIPDIICGVARGGWIPARLLSDYFEQVVKGIELANMRIMFYRDVGETIDRPIISQDISVDISDKKVLLVDDLTDTGNSLKVAVEYLLHKMPLEIRTATLLHKPWSKIVPTYYVDTTEKWVVFPHEYQEFMALLTKKNSWSMEIAEQEFKEYGIPEHAIRFFAEKMYPLLEKNGFEPKNTASVKKSIKS